MQRGYRGNPPASSRAEHGSVVHFLLHADHAKRMERQQRLREQKEKENVLREKLEGPQVRFASKATQEQIVQRLHGEAEQRRNRQAERRYWKDYADALQQHFASAPCGSMNVWCDDEEPRWERLHRIASQKEAHLEKQRRQAAEEQSVRMLESSVHRAAASSDTADAVVDAAGARLYAEGQRLLQRKKQLVQAAEEEERRQLQEVSIHRYGNPAAASWADTCNRLYSDGKQRNERLETRREQENQMHQASVVVHRGDLVQSVNRLYDDARKRDELRELTREKNQLDERHRMESESVHAKLKDWPYSHKDVARISDRLFRTRSLTPPKAPQPQPKTSHQRSVIGGAIGKSPRFPWRRESREVRQQRPWRDESAPPQVAPAAAREPNVLDDCAMAALRARFLDAATSSASVRRTLLRFIQRNKPSGEEDFELQELMSRFQADEHVLEEANQREQREETKEAAGRQRQPDETEEQWQRRLRKMDRAKMRMLLAKREQEEKEPLPSDLDELTGQDVQQVVRLIFRAKPGDISDEQIDSLCLVLGAGANVTFQALKNFLGLGRITLRHTELEFVHALGLAQRQRPPERPKAPLGRSRSAAGGTPRGSSTAIVARQGLAGGTSAALKVASSLAVDRGAPAEASDAWVAHKASALKAKGHAFCGATSTPRSLTAPRVQPRHAAALVQQRAESPQPTSRECEACSPQSDQFAPEPEEPHVQTTWLMRGGGSNASKSTGVITPPRPANPTHARQAKQMNGASGTPAVSPRTIGFKDCEECSPRATLFELEQKPVLSTAVSKTDRPPRSPRRGRSPRMSGMQRNPELMMQLVHEGALMCFPGCERVLSADKSAI